MAQHFFTVFHSQKGFTVACDLHPERLRSVAYVLEVMFVST
jgi:hypothetical protein